METRGKMTSFFYRRAGALAALLVASTPLWAGVQASAYAVYAAFGDSITEGYQVSRPWPSRLGGMVGQTVSNDGNGGKTTSWGLAHIRDVIYLRRPTHILLMFGTNDVNGPQDLRGSARNIREMAQICRESAIVPIVATIPPFIGPKADRNGRVQYFNDLVRGAADAYGYYVADVGQAFGSGSGLMQSDGFHPNDSGQEVIAQTFFPKTSLPAFAGKATLVAPSGDVATTRRPTFRWNSVSNAEYYHLFVQRGDAIIIDEWTQATTWTPNFDLGCANYTWWVRTWNQSGDGMWSNTMDFRYNGPDCCYPDQIKDLAAAFPGDGKINYQWRADPCATYNHLLVHRNGASWVDQWYPASPAGGWETVQIGSQPFGEYTYWVLGNSPDGSGPWSGAYSFSYGLAVPVAPSASITDRTPRFSWNDDASEDATYYQIYVSRNGTKYTSWWVSRANTGTFGDYRYADPPAGTTFGAGNYVWWIQTYKDSGAGLWSSGKSFSLPLQPPGVSAPVSPKDGVTVADRRPTLSWSNVAIAEWYKLVVNVDGRNYLSTWFEGVTSYQPAQDLPEGVCDWWILTWNSDGEGPWSSKATFNVPSLKPEMSNPLDPTGAVPGPQPVFTWSPADRATWYHLHIRTGGSLYYDKWFEGATMFTPTWNLAPGVYTWWVETYGDYGNGPWSPAATFTVP